MRDDMILCQQKVAEVLAQVNQIVIGKEECVRQSNGSDLGWRTYFIGRYTGCR